VPDKFLGLTPELRSYVIEHSPGDPLLARLRAETEEAIPDRAVMQVPADEGALLTLLVRAIQARRALELGTFTGYSSICIARGLVDDGRLITCDVSEEWTAVARRYWSEAGLEARIELRIGPALETLAQLPEDEPFDFAFIDADKVNYPNYWDRVLPLLRPGGLVAVDNVLFSGAVVDEDGAGDSRESLEAIRRTNEMIVADERVADVVMLGIADGITLAVKR
jgi:caffeoyl-CoA O-methyltransferase